MILFFQLFNELGCEVTCVRQSVDCLALLQPPRDTFEFKMTTGTDVKLVCMATRLNNKICIFLLLVVMFTVALGEAKGKILEILRVFKF